MTRVLAALSAGLSAIVAVYQVSPGAGLPQEALVALIAVSAGLSATVAMLAKPVS